MCFSEQIMVGKPPYAVQENIILAKSVLQYYNSVQYMLDVGMMNTDDDNRSPQELSESTGNDPNMWAMRAEALLTSAAVLNAQYPQVPSDDFNAFWGDFMNRTRQ